MSVGDQSDVTYEKSGRIKFRVAGQTHTLRPITLGEYNHVVDGLDEIQEQTLLLRKQIPVVEVTEGQEPDVEQVVAERRASRRVEKELQRMQVELLAEIFTILGDKPLPEDTGSWPAWLITNRTLLSEMIAHWRSVPLDRG